MSNPSQRIPGEEELGFSRLRRLQSDDASKRHLKEGTTNDPLRRKSKELDRPKSKEFEDFQERLSANRTRFDKLRNELGSTTDRLRRPQEFEDIQNRLSANRARLDSIKRADRGYSDEFHKNAVILFKLGKEAKIGLRYIEKHKELPPPSTEGEK